MGWPSGVERVKMAISSFAESVPLRADYRHGPQFLRSTYRLNFWSDYGLGVIHTKKRNPRVVQIQTCEWSSYGLVHLHTYQVGKWTTRKCVIGQVSNWTHEVRKCALVS